MLWLSPGGDEVNGGFEELFEPTIKNAKKPRNYGFAREGMGSEIEREEEEDEGEGESVRYVKDRRWAGFSLFFSFLFFALPNCERICRDGLRIWGLYRIVGD